jgi:actin-related protein
MDVDWQGQGRRGSHVVVIHFGSRYLRVGRASDVTPVTVPNVIARKTINAPTPTFIKRISRPRKGRARALPPLPTSNDEYAVVRGSDDPVRSRSVFVLAYPHRAEAEADCARWKW